MRVRAVYDCMMWLMQAARPERVHESFDLVNRGEVELCVSRDTLAEIHDVLTRAKHIAKFPSLTPQRALEFIQHFATKARFIDPVPDVYQLARDPKDSKYINLALAADATHLVTRDLDLLDLMNPQSPAGAQFISLFPRLQADHRAERFRADDPQARMKPLTPAATDQAPRILRGTAS